MSKSNMNKRLRSKAKVFSLAWWRRSENWMVFAITGIALAVVSMVLMTRMPPTADIDPAAVAAAELSDPRMKEIEHRFRCPCGNCGHLELEDCVCDVPGGAMEMKTVIARLLSEGIDEKTIVATIAADFGGLKTSVAEDRSPQKENGLRNGPEIDAVDDLHAAHSGHADPESIIEVVSQFDCPCGNCDLTLLECTCDRANGSVEVKAFIEENLEKGLSESDVIASVIKTFGAQRRLAFGSSMTNPPTVAK